MIESIRDITLIIISAGIFLLAGGIILYVRQRVWVARSLHAEGMVVELLKQQAQGERVRTKTEER